MKALFELDRIVKGLDNAKFVLESGIESHRGKYTCCILVWDLDLTCRYFESEWEDSISYAINSSLEKLKNNNYITFDDELN
jgi:hypothetical protein